MLQSQLSLDYKAHTISSKHTLRYTSCVIDATASLHNTLPLPLGAAQINADIQASGTEQRRTGWLAMMRRLSSL